MLVLDHLVNLGDLPCRTSVRDAIVQHFGPLGPVEAQAMLRDWNYLGELQSAGIVGAVGTVSDGSRSMSWTQEQDSDAALITVNEGSTRYTVEWRIREVLGVGNRGVYVHGFWLGDADRRPQGLTRPALQLIRNTGELVEFIE